MSKELTKEEVQYEFITYIKELVNYWDSVETKSSKEKLNGLAFSILTALDGESANLPAFIVAPEPHKDDKTFREKQGKNYYPENQSDSVKCNISGNLHSSFGDYNFI